MSSAMVVRNTAAGIGRVPFFTPADAPLRVLLCARIILDSRLSGVSADSGGQEVILVCLRGPDA